MKKNIIFLILFIFIGLLSGCNTTGSLRTDKSTLDKEPIVLNVYPSTQMFPSTGQSNKNFNVDFKDPRREAMRLYEYPERQDIIQVPDVGAVPANPFEMYRNQPELPRGYERNSYLHSPVSAPNQTAQQVRTGGAVITPSNNMVIYHGPSSGNFYVESGSRDVVRIEEDRFRPEGFEPVVPKYRVPGYLTPSGSSTYPAQRDARAYVERDLDPVQAANRLQRINQTPPIEQQGYYRSAEYRKVRIFVGTPAQAVDGRARPLGINDSSARGYAAALDALDRTAGEELYFFPEFGWGGFIRNP